MSIGRVPGDTGIQPTIVDAKGDIIAATAADSVSRLAVGTNNQVLTADSSQATGLKYANGSAATLTTTGDLLYASAANTPARLGIGSTDQVLKVSGGIPAWGAAPNPAYVGVSAYRNGTSTTLTANTSYAIPLTGENWDTDGFHDNTTNNTRFTIPSGKAGKYLLFMTVRFEGTANYAFFYINKNGAAPLTGIQAGVHQQRNLAANNWMFHGAFVCDAAVGDYFTFEVLNSDTQTAPMYANCSATFLGA